MSNPLRCVNCNQYFAQGHRCPQRQDRGICTIEGCESVVKVLSRGWCSQHYQRWQKHGDPLQAHHEYRTDNVGYEAIHTRLRDQRGLANQHRCVDCGRVAMDWSYQGDCSEEKEQLLRGGIRPVPYCVHIADHYQPRCRKCHVAMRRKYPRTPAQQAQILEAGRISAAKRRT